MSTMHHDQIIIEQKVKPERIKLNNETNYGVEIMDEILE